MKLDRTKRAATNLKWGIIDRIASLVIPFVCRTAVIQIFGIHYLGLSSLFTSLLSTLNLAELGFGSAVVYFMYRAVAEEDEEKICALLNYVKRVYQCVGLVVLGLGLILMPFLPYLIKSDVPAEVNIYVLYLLTLTSSVQSYFLYAYKTAVFRAHQRVDVLSKISTIVTVTEKILQLIFIFVFKNYYLYIASIVMAGVMNNLMVYFTAEQQYPKYKAVGQLDVKERRDILSKIRGLFMYKIGNVISASADSVVISAFLGLAIMGKYGNYYYVITALVAFFGVLTTSLRAGIGNSIVTESVEKNFNDFKTLQFAQNWLVGWCTVCLCCLFQDFITIYAGEQNRLAFGYVICLCLYFWSWRIQDIVYVFKEAAGMWMQDRYRPLIGALVNLGLNLFMVQYIGLYGVILSSVFVFVFVDILWAPKVLFQQYFKCGTSNCYKMLFSGFVQLILAAVPTYLICSMIVVQSLFLRLFIKAILCVIVPNVLYVIMNCRKAEYKRLINKVKNVLKVKL